MPVFACFPCFIYPSTSLCMQPDSPSLRFSVSNSDPQTMPMFCTRTAQCKLYFDSDTHAMNYSCQGPWFHPTPFKLFPRLTKLSASLKIPPNTLKSSIFHVYPLHKYFKFRLCSFHTIILLFLHTPSDATSFTHLLRYSSSFFNCSLFSLTNTTSSVNNNNNDKFRSLPRSS